MGKIELIKEAVEKAEREESKLDDYCFKIGSYSSPKIRHLINNLGGIFKTDTISPRYSYLEVGVHRGGTFVATLFRNNLYGTAIDNWSEFNEDGTVKKEFLENIKPFGDTVKFIEADCFKTELPKDEYSMYLYDGPHGYEEQKLGITYFYSNMKDEFILCIDDYGWEQVKKGTQDGIKEMGLTVLFEQELIDGYHNGFYVALLKK